MPNSRTKVIVLYPIIGALKTAREFLETTSEWETVDEIQREFISKYYTICEDEVDEIEEIERIANSDAEVLNSWLSERKYDLHFKPFSPLEFGVACALDVLVEWKERGNPYQVRYEGQVYPGVSLSKEIVSFYQVEGYNPIACVSTKTQDKVYMMMISEVPDGFGMIDLVCELNDKLKEFKLPLAGLVFPKVDLNIIEKLDWLKGIWVVKDNNPWRVSEAAQQTKMKMNEEGARVKSVVILRTIGGGDYPLMINRPFLMWIQRPNLHLPIFVGYLETDVWRDPGGLEM